MKILVLMGGDSAERDVSLVSGQAVAEGLRIAGHQVLALDTADSWKALSTQGKLSGQSIDKEPPKVEKLKTIDSVKALRSFESQDLKDIEVIFLALHGGKGEDGTIQAILDLSGKPYTGSGVLASALAMNKHMSKEIFCAKGIRTPEWAFLQERDLTDLAAVKEKARKLDYPLVVKPNDQGSTVGVSIIDQEGQLKEALKIAAQYSNKVLLERFIPGREITVAILEDKALPVVEIVPEHGIYDYECKYTPGRSRYVCPAELTPSQTVEVQVMALKAFQALGCCAYARVDFRMNPEGEFYCLEVNTLPGMTKQSLVPQAAQAAGISFPELVNRIAGLAIKGKKR